MTKNDVFYVASLVEFTARATCNHRRVVVERLGVKELQRQLELADVNHCLSMQQVCDELVEDFKIPIGTFDTVRICKYRVPSATAIGKVYMRLVLGLTREESRWAQTLYEVFSSPISDQISDFNSAFYFAPSDEILYYYRKETEQQAG